MIRRGLAAIFLCTLAAPAAGTEDYIVIWDAGAECDVLDGDSLRCGEARLRLAGIDAPERDQPYGRQATQHLIGLLKKHTVFCVTEKKDGYGRWLAVCTFTWQSGQDELAMSIAEDLVRRGLAFHYARYTQGERAVILARAQEQARMAGNGVWTGGFVLPCDWRREKARAPLRQRWHILDETCLHQAPPARR